MVEVKDMYKVIGLRDIDVVYSKKFDQLASTSEGKDFSPVKEIMTGYSNPYTVMNIILCRALCVEELLQIR